MEERVLRLQRPRGREGLTSPIMFILTGVGTRIVVRIMVTGSSGIAITDHGRTDPMQIPATGLEPPTALTQVIALVQIPEQGPRTGPTTRAR